MRKEWPRHGHHNTEPKAQRVIRTPKLGPPHESAIYSGACGLLARLTPNTTIYFRDKFAERFFEFE
jgi:hypothetical protein